jgi:hypothetical protein
VREVRAEVHGVAEAVQEPESAVRGGEERGGGTIPGADSGQCAEDARPAASHRRACVGRPLLKVEVGVGPPQDDPAVWQEERPLSGRRAVTGEEWEPLQASVSELVARAKPGPFGEVEWG